MIVQRSDLHPGATVPGPAIIEEYGSTVPIHPGFTVRVDDYLNLIVTRVASRDARWRSLLDDRKPVR